VTELNKSSSEAFNNKVSLIYEFNKTSPLFIRKAQAEMENNHVERAIEILNAGLKIYPDYAAAHLLLGKAWAVTGHFNEALKYIKSGCANLHSPRTYDYYLKQIDTAKKERSLFDSSRRTSYFDALVTPEQPVKPLPNEIKIGITEETIEELLDNEPPFNVDDHLAEIARKISSAKMKEPTDDFKYDPPIKDSLGDSSMIVSETLAKIYVTQGEYSEALAIYRKLIQKSPSKREYYQKKISEIQSKIE
jgi:tetratricopeptide (TPR) repeat protein